MTLSSHNRKILFIAFEYPPVRASTDRVYHFSRYLPELGWEVSVLTVAGRPPFHFYDESLGIPNDVTVTRTLSFENRITQTLYARRLIPFHNLFCLPAFFRGRKLLKKNPVDIIVATTPQVSEMIAAYWLSKVFGIPFVIDFRDPYYPPRLYTGLFRRILASAKGIVATSDVYREVVEKQSGRHDIAVIPNGVDLGLIEQNRAAKRPEFTIVYSGVLIDLYRVLDLLKAMRAVHHDISLKVVVIGETKGFENLTQFATDNELPVTFTGRLPYAEATRLASEATVAYNGSSHPGGLGGKMYDALAMGLPILGYFPEGTQSDRFVKKFNIGLAANTFDALKENLRRFAMDRSLVEEYRLRCLETARQFDRKKLTHDLSDYLGKLLTTP